MGIAEKLAKAKKTKWVSEGLSEVEVKTIVELAKISARIERSRIELGMTQQEFAEYMGVTQGMVSRWESREYNFTIKTLNDICQKIDLELFVSLEKTRTKSNYKVIRWNTEKVTNEKSKRDWTSYLSDKEAIA